MPHQVGYIERGDGQNVGEMPAEDASGISSKDKAPPPSVRKPTDEEEIELKAIMRGEKELSKDKDTRARQKELIRSMTAKSTTRDSAKGDTSTRSISGETSRPSASKPYLSELAEAKAIMKGQKGLSTEKDKCARQKELIKMITAKSTGTGKSRSVPDLSNSPTPHETAAKPPTSEELVELQAIVERKAKLSDDPDKRERQKALIRMMTGSGNGDEPMPATKGVRFDDEGTAGRSGSRPASSGSSRSNPSDQPDPSRSGSSSRSRGNSSGRGDPSVPVPRTSGGKSRGDSRANEE